MTQPKLGLEEQIQKIQETLDATLNKVAANKSGATNEHDVTIASDISETFKKCMELEATSKKEENALQQKIKEMEKEVELRKLEVNENIEMLKIASSTKLKMTEHVGTVLMLAAAITGMTTIAVTQSNNHKEIELEKIKQAEFE